MSRQVGATSKRRQYDTAMVDHAANLVKAKAISLCQAAKTYKIPKSTLHNRISNRYASTNIGAKPVLSSAEETRIVDWALHISRIGYGFSLCQTKGAKVIGSKGAPVVYHYGNSDKTQMTIMAAASAAGHYIQPMIIFPGQRFSYDPLEGFEEAALGRSETGWMDAEFFNCWLKNVFIPGVEARNVKKPVLLLIDGHTTHITMEASDTCVAHGIEMFCLLEHSSHVMQPLDLRLFSSLKQSWRQAVRDWQTLNVGEFVTKRTFARVFKDAWLKSTTVEAAVKGFLESGLFPLNAARVTDSIKIEPSKLFQCGSTSTELVSAISTPPTSNAMAIPASNDVIPSVSDAGIPPANDAGIPPANDAVMPAASDADIPSDNDAVIPPANDAMVPTVYDAVIPSANDAVIPSATDTSMSPANDVMIHPATNVVIPPDSDVVAPPNSYAIIPSTSGTMIQSGSDAVTPSASDIVKPSVMVPVLSTASIVQSGDASPFSKYLQIPTPKSFVAEKKARRVIMPKAITGLNYRQLLRENIEKKENELKEKQQRKEERLQKRVLKAKELQTKRAEFAKKREQREAEKLRRAEQKRKQMEEKILKEIAMSDTDDNMQIDANKCYACEKEYDDFIQCTNCFRRFHIACVVTELVSD